MSVYAGPEIVNQGLILHLDTGNTQSYPGTGTTWTDLSGNNNHATLVNSPTHTSGAGGYFTLDGTTQYAYVDTNDLPTTDFTFIHWEYPTEISTPTRTVWMATDTSGGNELLIMSSAASNGTEVEVRLNNSIHTSTLEHTVNTWNMTTVRRSGSSLQIYENNLTDFGSFTNSATLVYGTGAPSGIPRLLVGADTDSTNYGTINDFFQGRLGMMMVYNTALTDAEISNIFNATRGRYGV